MFSKTQLFAMSFAFPDVCYLVTPVGPIPVPLPNFAFSILAIPTVPNIFIWAMPVHNLITVTPISTGNEAGAPMGGVVSFRFIGEMRNLLSSFKVFYTCMPATRMLDMSGQNGTLCNMVGLNLTPSQTKVLILI